MYIVRVCIFGAYRFTKYLALDPTLSSNFFVLVHAVNIIILLRFTKKYWKFAFDIRKYIVINKLKKGW